MQRMTLAPSRRIAMLWSAALALSASASPALAQQAITTPILATDQNFRDLAGISENAGGSGFVDPTTHGGAMRTGVFYRSEALTTLSTTDWRTLSSLRIGLDVDLRTPSEIDGPTSITAPNAGHDWLPAGARYINVNIYGTDAPPSSASVATPGEASAYLIATYQNFVSDATQRGGFRSALLALANEPSAALFHCAAGKDRTGWTSMLLQSIAGVAPETILTAYLASNIYMAESISAALAQIRAAVGNGPAGDLAVATAATMLGVQESYLHAGLAQIVAQYGSMQAYLIQGLGLTQADIYVLRAKMVYFANLPGQDGMTGNAASGATLLNALQNSPLSGRYTAFNYYLQSAVDAGTLGGVESLVGGQLHADTVAFLARQPLWIDAALAPNASGRDLGVGETKAWLAGVGGYFSSDGGSGVSRSIERSGGPLAGVTWRIDAQSSAFVGVGYNAGSVSSAGGRADLDTMLATFGGRYGLSSLDAGPFAEARASVGWFTYHSSRILGGGLGGTSGDASGGVVSGRADIGSVIRAAQWTFTPQLGLRATRVGLGRIEERGSELALAVDRIGYTATSAIAGLDVALDPRQVYGWQIAPSLSLGYERALSNPSVETTAALYGYTVSQVSAYDSRNLVRAGFAIAARQDAATFKAGINAIRGDNASAGFDARVSIGYQF
ncbi:Autotransporter beta-domain [Rhodopseudomonas palustris BisB5]|uniref:Autotransporter beta-domain n=1 Tax=Rhodopseudomonas palustris (strain BisB5) TaxID=316057 RepID=Q132Z9_RHOPS|nr:Autotransporter beta-domain [Rhodopseudomonas palustris BisB5]